MTDEIVKVDAAPILTWDGKRVRTSKAQLSRALAPMFAAFPNLEMGDETFNAYYMLLADLDPDKLAAAVVQACQTHEYPTQLITVAAIRKAYQAETRAPGPWSDVDQRALPPLRTKFHRLPDDQDREERRMRLAMTKGWKYA